MKKINVVFVMLFLLVGTLSFVVAEDHDIAEETEIKEAKRVGFFGNAVDGIRFAFMFNKERKIEFALERAEKRLAEIEASTEDNPERAERAQERYDELLAKAEEILADIEARREDANGSVDYLGQIARIQNKFELHREHADEIYTRALERFEINNASDEKIERFEMFYERALNRSDRMEIKIIEKRMRARERHKNLANKSDDEVDEIIEGIESGEGLTDARIRREERLEIRIEKLDGVNVRRIERYELRLEGSDLSDDQRIRIERKIDSTNERFELRIENDRERIRIRTKDGETRIRIRNEDGETRIRIRDEDDSDDDDLDDDDESDSDDDSSGSDDSDKDNDDSDDDSSGSDSDSDDDSSKDDDDSSGSSS